MNDTTIYLVKAIKDHKNLVIHSSIELFSDRDEAYAYAEGMNKRLKIKGYTHSVSTHTVDHMYNVFPVKEVQE